MLHPQVNPGGFAYGKRLRIQASALGFLRERLRGLRPGLPGRGGHYRRGSWGCAAGRDLVLRAIRGSVPIPS